ncbi:hypothetical protein PR202_gb26371 [Eleusine coracana subsp. coracana]|uniref:Uncharacterized protein n=1 Tax=Eleusine coracana subsp. coracana TaxID=191504 RepID=A0AAV5FRN5_ELECO|nr:hypothetical protein PR202_gb26371 [Eleusine coracana subsp. coracana]
MGASPSHHEESSASSRVGDGHAVPVAASSATSGSNQAQSKRAPAPHKFHEIVAQEKTATAAELEDRVNSGIYLAGKTKKYWVHGKTRGNCFMLFPRALSITWCEDPRFWNWHALKETSDTEIEAVSLQNVCWLEIHGKLELSHLTPGVTYEVFFEVMLTKEANGWSVPVNLRLKFPNGTVQERKEKLQEKPRGQWLQLKVGEIKAQEAQKGVMEISMFEYDGGLWKKGLLIKCIKIVPKE